MLLETLRSHTSGYNSGVCACAVDLLHPFSIDVFEDYIYGVTYINNYVFRVNKFGRGKMENLTTGINHATDIVLYHRYKQPESESLCVCGSVCAGLYVCADLRACGSV